MMVRVYADVSCKDSRFAFREIRDVVVELTFGDGNLVSIRGETYVVAQEEVQHFLRIGERSNSLRKELFVYAQDAFNFRYNGSTPRPRNTGYLGISAMLMHIDSDHRNNEESISVLVKSSYVPQFEILYIPIESIREQHRESVVEHRLLVKRHTAFIEAIFPVVNVTAIYSYHQNNPWEPPRNAMNSETQAILLANLTLVRDGTLLTLEHDVDSVVWIVPYDSLSILGNSTAGMANPQLGKGVFVDERLGKAFHVSAHEIGHVYGLAGLRGRREEYDDDHYALYTGDNGWDVRRRITHWGQQPGLPRFNRQPWNVVGMNYQTHMGDHRVQRPWITDLNYRRLMEGLWP